MGLFGALGFRGLGVRGYRSLVSGVEVVFRSSLGSAFQPQAGQSLYRVLVLRAFRVQGFRI